MQVWMFSKLYNTINEDQWDQHCRDHGHPEGVGGRAQLLDAARRGADFLIRHVPLAPCATALPPAAPLPPPPTHIPAPPSPVDGPIFVHELHV